jgi:hypothetical protein
MAGIGAQRSRLRRGCLSRQAVTSRARLTPRTGRTRVHARRGCLRKGAILHAAGRALLAARSRSETSRAWSRREFSLFVKPEVSFLASVTLACRALRKSARDCSVADRRRQCLCRARCPANWAALVRLAQRSSTEFVSYRVSSNLRVILMGRAPSGVKLTTTITITVSRPAFRNMFCHSR